MLVCSKCGSHQGSGKFCGKCGGELIGDNSPIENVEVNASQVQTESNPSIEKVKETSRVFWHFWLKYVKRPGQIFENAAVEFRNGFIATILLTVLMSISLYLFVHNTGGYWYGPSFISLFGSTVFFLATLIAIIHLVLFVINKLFGKERSFKEIVSIYGAHMTPVLALMALTFILILLKSNTFGFIGLMIGLGLLTVTIPLYLISSLLTRGSQKLDPFYGYMLYIIAFGITYLIYISILADTMMGRAIDGFFYNW